MKGSLALAALLLGLFAMGCEPPETCDELAPRIIEMSEKNQDDHKGRVLKLYNAFEVRRSDSEFVCRGRAKWSRGDESSVEFYWERDQDGDAFIGYRRAR